MKKHHINFTTGDVGLCNAKKKCPFGDMKLDHFTKPEDARKHYEAHQKKKAFLADKFSDAMNPKILWLTSDPFADKPANGKMAGLIEKKRREIERNIGKSLHIHVEQYYSRTITEDEMNQHSRNALKNLDYNAIETKAFWSDYYSNLVESVHDSRTKKKGKASATSEVIGSAGLVGSKKNAEEFLSIVESFDESSIVAGAENKIIPLSKKAISDGWRLPKENGCEQIVMFHEPSQTVYKMTRNKDVPSYIEDEMLFQETFPRMEGVRYARTSGYDTPRGRVLAQEYVKDLAVDESEKDVGRMAKIRLALFISGHTDYKPANFSLDANGDLVAFDSGSIFYDDAMDYDFSTQR